MEDGQEVCNLMNKILNYIDGVLVEPCEGRYMDNYNPAEGKVYSLVPDSDVKDVENAVVAARHAFPIWSGTSPEKRFSVLQRLADLIENNLEKLATAESEDNGKPVKLAAQLDIPRAASNIRFFATAAMHFASESHATGTEALNYTLRSPVGVVGCISPWNLPLYLFTWKIAPALAAGCVVIAKPSELTPMTAFILSQLCIEAGLPKGVLNIIHGRGMKAGQAIVEHPEVAAISLLAGRRQAERLLLRRRQCSKNFRLNSAERIQTSFLPIVILKGL